MYYTREIHAVSDQPLEKKEMYGLIGVSRWTTRSNHRVSNNRYLSLDSLLIARPFIQMKGNTNDSSGASH